MERGLAGESGVSESTVSNTERSENEQRRSRDEKQQKIFKGSWGVRRRERERKCSNYTLFRVLRHNLHVKCCNFF